MKNIIWFTSVFVLFLVFVTPAILGLALNMTPGGDQPGYDSNKRISIYGERGASQKFVSREKNLTAIGTSIRNPNLKNKKEIVLNLYDENQNLMRTSILNGQNIQDGAFVKFNFQPISDSLNRVYLFTINSPDADPEETIELFYVENPSETVIEFTYDEETYPGGFPLVTFHKPESKLEIIKNIYSSWLSRLLSLGFQKS